MQIKKAQARQLLSILITLSVITMLIMAGTASAVEVDIMTDKHVYSKDETSIDFTVSIDIHPKEIVPLQSNKLFITQDGKPFMDCEFDMSGAIISGGSSCLGLDITLVNNGILATADMQAKGYGFGDPQNPENEKTNFGFGYGFMYEKTKSNFDGELTYNVQWNLAGVENGKYEARVESYAANDPTDGPIISYTYAQKRPTRFTIQFGEIEKSQKIAEVELKADNGVDMLNGFTSFTKEKAKFSADLREMKTGTKVDIDGRVGMTLYTQALDGTKQWLTLEMTSRDFDLLQFTKYKIQLTGRADIKYKKTNPITPTINIRNSIDVSMLIENGMLKMESTDPTLPFKIDLQVTEYHYTSH